MLRYIIVVFVKNTVLNDVIYPAFEGIRIEGVDGYSITKNKFFINWERRCSDQLKFLKIVLMVEL